jgi:hypothetical protein
MRRGASSQPFFFHQAARLNTFLSSVAKSRQRAAAFAGMLLH